MTLWAPHFAQFPKASPIVVHSEGRTMAAAILFASLYDRPVHIAHVARREEILLIRQAKESGIPVTCEVTPHHLLLTAEAADAAMPRGRSEVRPALGTPRDIEALWANLSVIDCIATDHAPHTLEEKDGTNPPPGFPGLESALPLLLTAVSEGKLKRKPHVQDAHRTEIFHLPDQPETWVEVDDEWVGEIRAAKQQTRCGWTPFEGWRVKGRVERVVLRGAEVFRDGQVLAAPGFGRDLRA
jgi:carbamoyl-phosphate synthase/aspartate carbamoyltransferase/dihydroorotase